MIIYMKGSRLRSAFANYKKWYAIVYQLDDRVSQLRLISAIRLFVSNNSDFCLDSDKERKCTIERE